MNRWTDGDEELKKVWNNRVASKKTGKRDKNNNSRFSFSHLSDQFAMEHHIVRFLRNTKYVSVLHALNNVYDRMIEVGK